VQEPSDLHLRLSLTQHPREEGEVVVVDPDQLVFDARGKSGDDGAEVAVECRVA